MLERMEPVLPASDLRDGWMAATQAERTSILAAVTQLVIAELAQKMWYPGSNNGQPDVDVYAAIADGPRMTVHFVADYMIYCSAQSGSDWANNYVYVGTVTFTDGKLVAHELVLVRDEYLSERRAESFDTRAVAAGVRHDAIAQLKAR